MTQRNAYSISTLYKRLFLWRERFHQGRQPEERTKPSCHTHLIRYRVRASTECHEAHQKTKFCVGTSKVTIFFFFTHPFQHTCIHPRRPYFPLHTNRPLVRGEKKPPSQDETFTRHGAHAHSRSLLPLDCFLQHQTPNPEAHRCATCASRQNKSNRHVTPTLNSCFTPFMRSRYSASTGFSAAYPSEATCNNILPALALPTLFHPPR